jgi:hypothetical protein
MAGKKLQANLNAIKNKDAPFGASRNYAHRKK